MFSLVSLLSSIYPLPAMHSLLVGDISKGHLAPLTTTSIGARLPNADYFYVEND